MPYYINPPPQNLLTRIIAAIVAVFALIGSFMIGLAALMVVAGVALIAGIAIWLRVALLKRRLRKSGVNQGYGVNIPPDSGQIIDAEYTVISEPEKEQKK